MSLAQQPISQTAHSRIRRVSTVAMIFVALAAAVLSWHGLTMLGEQAGFDQLSVLLPLVIDGTMLVGALHVLHASLSGMSTRWGWGMTLVGVAFSTWGNVAGASTTGIASGIVHAIPALALAASVEATMRIIRHGIAVTDTPTEIPAATGRAPVPPRGGGQSEPDNAVFQELRVDPSELVSAAPNLALPPSKAAAPPVVTPPVQSPEPARVPVPVQSSKAEKKPSASQQARTHLRAVGEAHTISESVPRELVKLAAWVRERKATDQSDSAAQAFQAGVSTSQSTAKRGLARLRSDFPHALEPALEATETGS